MLVIQAVPPVVIAMLVMFTFALGLRWFPTGNAYTPGIIPDWSSWTFYKDVLYHAALPLFCATVIQIGGFLINMRNNMNIMFLLLRSHLRRHTVQSTGNLV